MVLYADNVTDSMRRAIDETYRRREKQVAFNDQHGIQPDERAQGDPRHYRYHSRRWRKRNPAIRRSTNRSRPEESGKLIKELEKQMRKAAKDLDFERAALLRDQIREIRAGQQEVLIAE